VKKISGPALTAHGSLDLEQEIQIQGKKEISRHKTANASTNTIRKEVLSMANGYIPRNRL
jgi:hypothetical protein